MYKRLFSTESVGTFVIYLHAIFLMANSTSSLVLTVRQKAKYNNRVLAMLLFYVPQGIATQRFIIVSWRSGSGAGVTPPSQVREASMLILLIIENLRSTNLVWSLVA
jgi:hypothetical protein